MQLSICIPTYNRADLLDYCLDRLKVFEACDISFEVSISDNASVDHTEEIVRNRQMEATYIRYHRQSKTITAFGNMVGAVRMARGDYCLYLADDDQLIPEKVVEYVRYLQDNPGVVALYADWIGWDDHEEKEIYRYFNLDGPRVYGKHNALELLNLVIRTPIYPEIWIARTNVMQRIIYPQVSAGIFYVMLGKFLSHGDVCFQSEPFYKESRVVKRRFSRERWIWPEFEPARQIDTIVAGVELLALEILAIYGQDRLPADQRAGFLRALQVFSVGTFPHKRDHWMKRQNWIAASEVQRRLMLWRGMTESADTKIHAEKLPPKAAAHAAVEIFRVVPAERLLIYNFGSDELATFIRQSFLDVPVVTVSKGRLGTELNAERAVVIFEKEEDRNDVEVHGFPPGFILSYGDLESLFRILPVNASIGSA